MIRIARPLAATVALLLALGGAAGARANEVVLSAPAPPAGTADGVAAPAPAEPDITALAEALVEAANRRESAAAALAALPTAPAAMTRDGRARATLRPETTIERPFIHLGDVFGDLPESMASVPVGHAPDPGGRLVLDARYLAELATEYGVDWMPASRFVQAVVHRRGYDIGRAHVLEAVRARLLEAGMPADAEVDVSVLNVHATVGTADEARVTVRDLYFDDRTGRFNALVDVPAEGPNSRPVRLTGSTHVSIEVPVLVRPLRRGMVVRAEDVRWDTMREGNLRPDILLDPDDLIGKAARNGIQAGQPVRANQVTPPEVVERNGLVTMVLETPFMTVTARGRALEAGAVGDTVRVANVASDKEVLAEVTGRNAVRVRAGTMSATVN
ncbi:flagellar basal body P-ring formation chaperone FlgA [Roseospira goensis]|uniref:Flagella basal body P-ring formation protein FlgA n=1 Tax=Roseospira goensis TaxID=391922 RepID=A0A7W6WLE7_9PROT|nr:flagellar basal body P-ring formation chaperone FlgA [Roseospira goensis]MBB4287040.1 flagella basal body P-ring formation protein FlgA [Roseospira goensis]